MGVIETYGTRYIHGGSGQMDSLIAERDGDDPKFLGADDEGNELYVFSDNEHVILTNAGIVSETEDGFAEAKAAILRP